MGAISFSLDDRLVRALQQALPLRTFVETGTFEGDTLASLSPLFDRLLSVELSESLWAAAVDRFKAEPKIELSLASSPDFLAGLRSSLGDASTLYWLDAHWCAVQGTAGEQSQCPLLAELRAIGRLSDTSAVLIDDARLFLAPPAAPHEVSQWPRFHEIVTALLSLSAAHEIMVVNDVITFFPTRARGQMDAYAQTCGVDWIEAASRIHDNVALAQALAEKERMIQTSALELREKEDRVQEMVRWLEEKEEIIQNDKRQRELGLLKRVLGRVQRS